MKYFLAIIALLGFISPITAHASACPSTEVVFARGTNEPPGVGEIGQAFVDALHPDSVYAVDYPASMDFRNSILQGVGDAANHIEGLVGRCPGTRIVLGGYSQGAALAAFVTSDSIPEGIETDLRPLSDSVARHVKAVVVFGLPDAQFTGMLGVPPANISSRFASKQLCVEGDPICDGGGDFGRHSMYIDSGMVVEGAQFARNHL